VFGHGQHDRKVGLPFAQVEDARHGDELDHEIRMGLPQSRQPRGEEKGSDAVGRTNSHGTADPQIAFPDLLSCGIEATLDILRGGRRAVAGRRQTDPVGSTLDELCPSMLLQGADVAADRRVLDPECPRRCRERALPGNGQQGAQVIPVEASGHGLVDFCTADVRL
jgi:hypothetical protein